MQVCTSLQTDNHARTPPLNFLQAGCRSCRPTNSVKALKANWHTVIQKFCRSHPYDFQRNWLKKSSACKKCMCMMYLYGYVLVVFHQVKQITNCNSTTSGRPYLQCRYTQNGLLGMLDRNRRIKPKPERFQECNEHFDVIITCEERVYDQVIEGKLTNLIIMFILLFMLCCCMIRYTVCSLII